MFFSISWTTKKIFCILYTNFQKQLLEKFWNKFDRQYFAIFAKTNWVIQTCPWTMKYFKFSKKKRKKMFLNFREIILNSRFPIWLIVLAKTGLPCWLIKVSLPAKKTCSRYLHSKYFAMFILTSIWKSNYHAHKERNSLCRYFFSFIETKNVIEI